MKKYKSMLVGVASVLSLALLVPAVSSAQSANVQGQAQVQTGGGIGGFFRGFFGGGKQGNEGNGDQAGQGDQQGQHMGGRGGMMAGQRPAVVGSVTAISGTTLTVTQMQRPNATTSAAVYSVDASNATVYKNNATSSVSSIATGDSVFVAGTVNGTNVTATVIRDGKFAGRGGANGAPGMMGGKGGSKGPQLTFQGNGQPVVAGSVTAVSGNTVSITNKSNVSYTIDTSSANIQKQGTGTTTVSNIAVGDTVLVQGTVNDNAVVASSLIDQGVAPTASVSGTAAAHPGNRRNF